MCFPWLSLQFPHCIGVLVIKKSLQRTRMAGIIKLHTHYNYKMLFFVLYVHIGLILITSHRACRRKDSHTGIKLFLPCRNCLFFILYTLTKKSWMNQGILLSWGCTGNALSNQWSIDNEETTCSLDKPLPDQSRKGEKLSQSGISMIFQKNLLECTLGPHQNENSVFSVSVSHYWTCKFNGTCEFRVHECENLDSFQQ